MFEEQGFLVTIGLEVHCELLTETKLFCSCANSFGQVPNTNICPVCLGLPGSLPVINSRAVDFAIRIGLSLNCEIRPSVFHRKNYFYPDMPKGYQVSQYDEPICVNGYLELPSFDKKVRVLRAHMEEDTGKSTHIGRIHGAEKSLVDFNRAGVPLVEIVSEPDMTSADEAREYVSELRSILVASGATDGKMEEGSLRVDANVSVRRVGTNELGTRCEIKNLNSLRSLGRAITYEAKRQIEVIEDGGAIKQETRHWNEDQGRTSGLRSKEEAYDYRYFPEPDLTPLAPSNELVDAIRSQLPIMPPERRNRLRLAGKSENYTRSELEQIQTCVNFGSDEMVLLAVSKGVPFKLALARAANEVTSIFADDPTVIDPGKFVELVSLEASSALSATQSKAVLAELAVEPTKDVKVIIAELGFVGLSADELAQIVNELIESNPKEWLRYVEGENQLGGFFIGKAMKVSNGKINGREVAQIMERRRNDILASR